MDLTKNTVIDCLEQVKDPLTGRSIVSAGRIKEIKIDQRDVKIILSFDSNLDAAQKSSVNFACIGIVKTEFPSAEVHVHVETQGQTANRQSSVLPHVTNIIAVASGKGGVGKSTVSANIALGLRSLGHSVGIIDADLYGPSIPTMLNLEGQKPQVVKVHGRPKMMPLEAYDIKVMSIGFIVEPEQAVVLRGPRLAGIIKQFIQETIWPDLEFLIVDLPPGTGDIQLTLVQTVPVTGAVIVTTPQKVAVNDAIKAVNMFRMDAVNVPILGIVENMSWFTPPDHPEKKYPLFGSGGGERLAQFANSSCLGQIPMVQAIQESGDIGTPAVVGSNPEVEELWMDIARNVKRAVLERNRNVSATQVVEIKT